MFNQNELKLKNEILKIFITFNEMATKIINLIKSDKNKKEIKTKEEGDVNNKLDDILTIVEKIYDFSAQNENSHLIDNYNYYNIVKNQIISYFDQKMELIMEKTYKEN